MKSNKKGGTAMSRQEKKILYKSQVIHKRLGFLLFLLSSSLNAYRCFIIII